MGLNIGIYRLSKARDEEGYLLEEKRVESTSVGWDHLRYSGDRDFALSNLFYRVSDREPNPESFYHRPNDFNEVRDWVRANVVPGNQARLLNILDVLEKDETLYFSFNW